MNSTQSVYKKQYDIFTKEHPEYVGNNVLCNICGFQFAKLLMFGKTPREAKCPVCSSLERHRHLYIHLTSLWPFLKDKKILHFSPELFLKNLLSDVSAEYYDADFESKKSKFTVDMQQIQFEDSFFDYIIAIHVLEHIPNDKKAISELFRVLKPEGLAILSVPGRISGPTLEDMSLTPEQREHVYHQADHLRMYSHEDFLIRLQTEGFICKTSHTKDLPRNIKDRLKLHIDDRIIFAKKTSKYIENYEADFLSSPLTLNSNVKNKNMFNYNEFKKDVCGWCSKNVIIDILDSFDLFQENNMITGSVMEIGVHHGKFFIPIHNKLRNDECSYAVDVFENQEFNLDKSGCGDFEKFVKNMNNFGVNPKKCVIVKKDSLSWDYSEIINNKITINRRSRIISIDGSHTVTATVNDLLQCEKILTPGGIIFVDDFSNIHWPGVSCGVHKFFIQYEPRISPFFLGLNKLILGHNSWHEKYFNLVFELTKNKQTQKVVEMYGRKMVGLVRW